MKPKISENIKAFRLQKKLTQKELAVSLSVSPQAVSRWEQGQAYPDMFMLEKLASFFGVTMDALVGRGEEYVTGLRHQWYEMRFHIDSPEDAKQECDILEKLAIVGHERIQYLRALIAYKDHLQRPKDSVAVEKGLEKRLESARAMIKEQLKNISVEERLNNLQSIFLYEEEAQLEQWKEFLPSGFEFLNYSDMLLLRYRNAVYDPEKYQKELQHNLHRRIIALLYSLASDVLPSVTQRKERTRNTHLRGELHPVEYLQSALELLKIYSARVWDIFLPERSTILIRYAAALLKDGREEEAFAVLDTLKDTMLQAHKCFMAGEAIKGSVAMLSEIEGKDPMFFLGRMLDYVENDINLPEFAMCQAKKEEVQRIRSEIIQRLHAEEQFPEFKALVERAREEIRSVDCDRVKMVLVMEYEDGSLHTAHYDPYEKEKSHEEQASDILDKDSPIVKRMVVYWSKGDLEMPSYAIRQKLLSLHTQNADTLILTRGYYKYNIRKLKATMQ